MLRNRQSITPIEDSEINNLNFIKIKLLPTLNEDDTDLWPNWISTKPIFTIKQLLLFLLFILKIHSKIFTAIPFKVSQRQIWVHVNAKTPKHQVQRFTYLLERYVSSIQQISSTCPVPHNGWSTLPNSVKWRRAAAAAPVLCITMSPASLDYIKQ